MELYTTVENFDDTTASVTYEFIGTDEEIDAVMTGMQEFYDMLNEEEYIDCNVSDSPVIHPPHYNHDGGLETIWEMISLYGIEETKSFCKLNAHKYRARASEKGGEEDMEKSDYYIKLYTYLTTTDEDLVYEQLRDKYNDNFRDL